MATLFERKAPGIMSKLMSDFPIGLDDAAAILGNIGHECGGFTLMQEQKPTIEGSRGGWGWCQWTGPRRRAFEAYCRRNNLHPAGDEANYAYLFVELKGLEGSEGGAIDRLRAATGLRNKVVAFEDAFLRAGIKHHNSRYEWAQKALAAFKASAKPAPQRQPDDPGPVYPPAKKTSPVSAPVAWTGIGLLLLTGATVAWEWIRALVGL